jgi:hypothetical protein
MVFKNLGDKLCLVISKCPRFFFEILSIGEFIDEHIWFLTNRMLSKLISPVLQRFSKLISVLIKNRFYNWGHDFVIPVLVI